MSVLDRHQPTTAEPTTEEVWENTWSRAKDADGRECAANQQQWRDEARAAQGQQTISVQELVVGFRERQRSPERVWRSTEQRELATAADHEHLERVQHLQRRCGEAAARCCRHQRPQNEPKFRNDERNGEWRWATTSRVSTTGTSHAHEQQLQLCGTRRRLAVRTDRHEKVAVIDTVMGTARCRHEPSRAAAQADAIHEPVFPAVSDARGLHAAVEVDEFDESQ